MAKGLVSFRTGKDNRREFETSKLIRVYGELRTDETARRHGKGHSESNNATAENPQLEEIQKQLSDLQQSVTLMLEDKTARKAEISRLNEVLKQEKKRGVWSRIFRRNNCTHPERVKRALPAENL